MTVAMIMSKDRLEQEHSMLNRLVVGLANEGTQVIRIVPSTPNDEPAAYEKAVSLAKRIATPMPISLILRTFRKEELIKQMGKTKIQGIVAYGKDAQQVAFDIAPHFDAPILKEIISMQEARRVRKSSKVWRWLAPTPSMEKTIAQRVGANRVALVPLAASRSTTPEPNQPNKKRCIAVLDAAADLKATGQILEAAKDFEDTHLFLELTGSRQQKIWKLAHKLGILNSVTFLRDMASVRTLIVQCDVVVVPSKTIPLRSILLEAMLASIPIVSTSIDGFDMLVDDETAIITDGEWGEPLCRILDDPQLAARLGKTGARLIHEQYASAIQIAAFEAAFTLI
jgi:glycosyltransferase involved in cell wall biosynthesis